MKNSIKDKIILALDIPDEEKIKKLLEVLKPAPKIIKIGLELIAFFGIEKCINLIDKLSPESDLFLDFKLHDIPNTVQKTIIALKKYNKIKYLTVHLMGSNKMLKAALESAENQINLVGVTVLTSHSKEDIYNLFNLELNELSYQLISSASQTNLKWLVASPLECRQIKQSFSQFKIITPGIRIGGSDLNDQARIATPDLAIEMGADLLVIGRPIYSSENPCTIWDNLC